MPKFHITAKGDPALCKASIKCRLAGEDEHYETADGARSAFEASQGAAAVSGPVKRASTMPDREERFTFTAAMDFGRKLLDSLGLAHVKLRFAQQDAPVSTIANKWTHQPEQVTVSQMWVMHHTREQVASMLTAEVRRFAPAAVTPALTSPDRYTSPTRPKMSHERATAQIAEDLQTRVVPRQTGFIVDNAADLMTHPVELPEKERLKLEQLSETTGYSPDRMHEAIDSYESVQLLIGAHPTRRLRAYLQAGVLPDAIAHHMTLPAPVAGQPERTTRHRYGSRAADAVEATVVQVGAEAMWTPETGEVHRTSKGAKPLNPEIIEALKFKYLKKFKQPFDESGLSIPELLKLASTGQLD